MQQVDIHAFAYTQTRLQNMSSFGFTLLSAHTFAITFQAYTQF